MRALLLIATIASISACSTLSSGGLGLGAANERKEIVALEEMSLEYIQSLWGKPEVNIPAGEGRTVRFKNIRTEIEDPISEKVQVKYCDVRLDINKRQLVQKWEYETCRPKN